MEGSLEFVMGRLIGRQYHQLYHTKKKYIKTIKKQLNKIVSLTDIRGFEYNRYGLAAITAFFRWLQYYTSFS